MIRFKDWKIKWEGPFFIQQFDNLTRTLMVSGDIPEGWEWVILVKSGKNMDILPLEVMDGGVGTVLTRQQLACSGKYHLQLRGTKGELVRHTNMITVDVDVSLSGDVQWPEIPSLFSELERRITTAANRAETAGEHYPIVNNGTWWLWEPESATYVDTGKLARGEQGEQGYTPQRGTDYWTEADKAEIKSYVDEAILGGAW